MLLRSLTKYHLSVIAGFIPATQPYCRPANYKFRHIIELDYRHKDGNDECGGMS